MLLVAAQFNRYTAAGFSHYLALPPSPQQAAEPPNTHAMALP